MLLLLLVFSRLRLTWAEVNKGQRLRMVWHVLFRSFSFVYFFFYARLTRRAGAMSSAQDERHHRDS